MNLPFRSGLYLLLAFICYAIPARSQSLSALEEIRVFGGTVFAPDELRSFFQWSPGSSYSPELLQKDIHALLTAYHERGYLNASLDSVTFFPPLSPAPNSVYVYLDESLIVRIGSIGFTGISDDEASQLVAGLDIQIGDPLDSDVVEDEITKLLTWYEQRGYLLASVLVENLTVASTDTGSYAAIDFSISRGPVAQVRAIVLEGNETTKDEVVLREIRADVPFLYSPESGVRLRERLERLGIFSSVVEPMLFLSDSNTVGLLIQVKEGRPNRFDGLIGYIPGTAGSSTGYVTGLIDLQFKNLFGTARQLHLRWHRLDRYTQELLARYEEPWIGGIPVNGGIDFFQRKQDTTYVLHRYGIDGSYMVNEEFSLGASYRGSSVVPSGSGLSRVSRSSTTEFGLWVLFDARDNIWSPTSGVLYRTSYDRGTKSISGSSGTAPGSRAGTDRVTLDLLYYRSIFPKHVFHIGLYGRVVDGSNLDESDVYRLGGASTVRGYREDQFVAPRFVWSTVEYRFLTGQRSYAFAFFDWAYVAVPDGSVSGLAATEETKVGYGAGLQVDTQLGLVGMSIAFGEGDTFGTAKLHLRISNEF